MTLHMFTGVPALDNATDWQSENASRKPLVMPSGVPALDNVTDWQKVNG